MDCESERAKVELGSAGIKVLTRRVERYRKQLFDAMRAAYQPKDGARLCVCSGVIRKCGRPASELSASQPHSFARALPAGDWISAKKTTFCSAGAKVSCYFCSCCRISAGWSAGARSSGWWMEHKSQTEQAAFNGGSLCLWDNFVKGERRTVFKRRLNTSYC